MNLDPFLLPWPGTLAAALLYVLAAGRFLAFRRHACQRHRWCVSLAACVLSGALLCRAVELLSVAHVGAPELVIIVWLCAAVWRSHGNLAVFFRGPNYG